jgi:hypothetical protein
MRCHEARQKIIEIVRNGAGMETVPEFKAHLADCPECAAYWQAEITLERDMEQAGVDDGTDKISFAELKTRVETAADSRGLSIFREITIMKHLKDTLLTRPKLSFSIVGVILLVLMTLVPFKFEDTIGYEMAIAGVDKNLALDESRLTELFTALGLSDAVWEVGNCEQTCVLKISELDNEADIKVIRAAFDKMGHCTIEDVKEIQGERSKPIVIYVKDKVVRTGELSEVSEDEINQFVIKCLDSLTTSRGFSIWYTDNSSGAQILAEGDKLGIALECCSTGIYTSFQDSCIFFGDDGKRVIVNASDTDPELAEKLKNMGISLKTNEGGESVVVMKRCIPADCGGQKAGENADETVSKDDGAQVPGTFSLAQNYPNPFNPNTSIGYTLGATAHVTLEIVNMNGQVVRTLVDETQTAGEHAVSWDAINDDGKRVASGVYLYRLRAGDYVDSRKMTLLK